MDVDDPDFQNPYRRFGSLQEKPRNGERHSGKTFPDD
jgi:hypothetical protein